MGIEISTITDAKLKRFAAKADVDKNGEIDDAELDSYGESLWLKKEKLESHLSKNDANPGRSGSALAGVLAAAATTFYNGCDNNHTLSKVLASSKLVKSAMRKGLPAKNIHVAGIYGAAITMGVAIYGLSELERFVRDKVIDKKIKNMEDHGAKLSQLSEMA